MVRGGAIAEQGEGKCGVFSPVDAMLVHAVEHEVHVGNRTGIPPKELQQPPDGEHGPTLHACEVEIHEQPPPVDDNSESRGLPRLHKVREGYPGGGPGVEVAEDEGEEAGAVGRGGGTGEGRGRGRARAGEVGASDDVRSEGKAGSVVEGSGREEVPGGGAEVVPGHGGRLLRQAVSLVEEE
ncbi:hypothetical protein MLD38_025180 [Melastoma candidum]|uniref:Uncharacterized protein n=1 Tax=Melastoma candidum TaxID=119954 RepID=A0ACB9NUJ1_9MYRT|nr:hypothetical protein MLD38_025180 [Melastoma candidum]